MKYTNLLISGGGVYGIMILGIIKYLQEYNILININKYLGTSVGAIICLLLNINYSINEIHEFINNFQIDLLIKNFSDIKINLLDNLINNYGLNNNNNLKCILENLLEYKNFKKDITFKELYLQTNKDLIINISCINDCKSFFYNYITNPDSKVIDIILISCSIPIIFNPVKIDNKYYVDGGLYCNTPINYFKNELDKTLIIANNQNNFNNINNLESYLFNLFSSKLNYIEYENEMNDDNTIYCIKLNNINMIKFNLTKEEKENLFNEGTKISLNFIKTHFYYNYYLKKNMNLINIYE